MSVYSSRGLQRKLAAYFVPTIGEVVLYLALALLLLIVSRSQTIVILLINGNSPSLGQPLPPDVLTNLISKLTRGFGMLTVVCFWSFLGCLIYSLYWFVVTLGCNLRQHHKTSKELISPGARKYYWQTALSHQLAFITVVLSIPGYIYFFILDPWPLASKMALVWLTNFSWFNLATAILAVASVAAKLYVLHMLIRIFKYSIRTRGFRHHAF